MDYLKDWIWWFISSLQGFFQEVATTIVDMLLYWVPDEFATGTFASGFAQYWVIANHWIPLSEAVGMYTSLLVFQCVVITVRWIVRFIPFIGG